MPVPENITAAVDEFNKWVSLPRCPVLTPELMHRFDGLPDWERNYLIEPSLPGCYIFCGANDLVLYIGSVSCNNELGRRFGSRYISCEKNADGEWKKRRNELLDATAIYVVAVPKSHAFITPAIEQFLITALNPVRNVKCRIKALREELRTAMVAAH